MLTHKKKLQVIELWEQGLTGSQIAEELNITRCSVLGYISRQRRKGHVFSRDDKREARRLAKPNKNAPFLVNVKKVKKEKEIKVKIKKPERPKKEDFILEPVIMPTRDGGIDLFDLKLNSCRFIISPEDAPVRYCGHEKSKESYCLEHHSLCYYPARKDLEKSIKI